MEVLPAVHSLLAGASLALTLGFLAFVGLTISRLSTSDRRKWWHLGFVPVHRAWLPGLILTAVAATVIGALRASDAWALFGACSSCAAAAIAGVSVQQFFKNEARRRKVEMEHWTVRKPAEQRLAHQAMLRREELDRVQAAALRRLMDPHFLFNALNGATCCGKPGHEGRTEQHNRERPTEHEGTAEQQTQPSTSPTLRWTRTTRHGNVVPADALPAGATGGDSSDQNDVAVL